MNRSLRRLYLALASGFGAVVLMLGYWQIVAADRLSARSDNPRVAERELLIDRGNITTADGVVVARSRAVRRRDRQIFQRVYPRPTLVSNAIGYSSPNQGTTGLESSWNRYLGGSFSAESLFDQFRSSTKRGASIRLTVDSRIQQAAITAMAGREGAVVAIEPATGNVLALLSTPSFDLSKVAGDFGSILKDPNKPLYSRATQSRYPPGSTFKVLTTIAALDSGTFSPTSPFVDRGRYEKNGRAITNFGGHVYGAHDLQTALVKSINTTFATIGAQLGPEKLGKTMTAFGFGTRPGIDLRPEEVFSSGRFREGKLLANEDPTGDSARLAIGQEQLDVTPLQMAIVAATIANGGLRMTPHLVSQVKDRGGDIVKEVRPEEAGRATSPETAAAVAAMMRRVVEEGTGQAADVAGLSVAGKTGTAETGRPGQNDAWFIGFAPQTNAKVAVAVVIANTPATGGGVAAPVAAAVMRAALAANGGTP